MTKSYDELLDDLSAYNERTKAATETYEQSLVSIVAATQEVVGERDNANKWASAPEDELIDDGTNTPDYSANHYAKKAEATSQGVADLVQDAEEQVTLAEEQVELAKDQVAEATIQAGIAAANHILMTEAQSRAIRSLNENKYAASGMVHIGKQDNNGSTYNATNEGLWSNLASSGHANSLKLGATSGIGTTTGTSKTDYPVAHIAGAVAHIIDMDKYNDHQRSQFLFQPAPDGTDTYNKTTGELIKHPDAATAFALADTDVNIEVVTHPVDLAMFEYYEEELTGRQEIFECIQSLSTTFGDTDVPTVLSTRPLSYFQQYDGQFDNPDLQNDKYRCVVWSDLTDEQKREVAAYMGEKLFVGNSGNIKNGKLWATVKRGLGNGDWHNINPTKGNLEFKSGAPVLSRNGHPYVQDTSNKGVFTDGHGCFAYVVATVPRANQGAYHPDLNPWGTRKFNENTSGWGNWDWYFYAVDTSNYTTKDCFLITGGNPATGDDFGAYINSGAIGQASGHPDGIFYDGIEAGGLNGVIDWRLPAEEMQSQWLYAERKHQCAKYRGVEILADNTSVSGKFMHTYKETVGGSITLPRTCLGSTVECVHSSDGGTTWTKTNPIVNQANNTVTLPLGGESVVSFHAYAKQTAPSSNAPVVSGGFGLGPVVVQDSSDIKKGALLRESVTGVISTGAEYTNLGILRSTIVDELVIDYETMAYTPEAGSAQLQSQLVEENGQLFIQYHDGTSYHRSAISIGWVDQRARVGGENTPA